MLQARKVFLSLLFISFFSLTFSSFEIFLVTVANSLYFEGEYHHEGLDSSGRPLQRPLHTSTPY